MAKIELVQKRELKERLVYKLQCEGGKVKEWRYLGVKIMPSYHYLDGGGKPRQTEGGKRYLGEFVHNKQSLNLSEHELWCVGSIVLPLFLQ